MDMLLTKDLTLSVNFGTRYEERRGPNATEGEVFYELNHTPGWLFPIAYTIGEGEDEKLYTEEVHNIRIIL